MSSGKQPNGPKFPEDLTPLEELPPIEQDPAFVKTTDGEWIYELVWQPVARRCAYERCHPGFFVPHDIRQRYCNQSCARKANYRRNEVPKMLARRERELAGTVY